MVFGPKELAVHKCKSVLREGGREGGEERGGEGERAREREREKIKS